MSDYICASFLNAYRRRNAFIITQAPMKDTVGDFWRMVWEHNSANVVMLNQLVEDGKTSVSVTGQKRLIVLKSLGSTWL